MSIDPAALSDDDLRALIALARQRLPHVETCEHCEDRAARDKAAAQDYRRYVGDFNDHAARAGYLIPSNKTLVHRWDCPSIQAYLREVVDFTNGDGFEETLRGGADLPLPTIATLHEARVFIRDSKSRRGCKTCSPDL